jgi:hypothetical protein
VNAQVKVPCLVAGMIAGADSIDDMAVLGHGAMPVLFGGVRAPSTLGSFLRSFTWGNVLQLGKVHREFLAELARRTPLLPGADVLAFIDVDSQQKRVYGHHKQGAAFGFAKTGGKGLLVRGLNVLAATVCTPLAAPVIAGTRLRGGNASSARGAASMITEAVSTARAAGCTGTLIVRMDSAFYGAPACSAARAAGACFSATVRTDPKVRAAIAAIGEDAWTAIRYPRAIWDDQLRCWVLTPRSPRRNTPRSPRRRGRPSPPGSSSAASVTSTATPRPPGRASCSPPGGTTPSSPTRRMSSSRPRSTTVATPRPSRSSPTGPTARSRTCPPDASRPMRPGWSAPRSRTTCCAPPTPWPASPTPRPEAPPSAAT